MFFKAPFFAKLKFQINFEYVLNGTMDFSRCKRFSIRGYNKAKLYSTVSTEIKDCGAFNPILIQPNIVIDAVGAPDVNGKSLMYRCTIHYQTSIQVKTSQFLFYSFLVL